MNNSIQDELKRLMFIYASTELLQEHGYTDVLDVIMKDKTAVKHIMNKYDMVWRNNDKEYKESMVLWKELLNRAQTAPSVDQTLLNALMTHIMDMSKCRSDNPYSTDRIKQLDKRLVGPDERIADNASSYNGYSYDDDIAAEPEESYGNDKSVPESDWISIRRGVKKPDIGESVLVAGWYYAGVAETIIGKWKGKGRWEYDVPYNYNKPQFTPLFWKKLPKVPDSIMEEVP